MTTQAYKHKRWVDHPGIRPIGIYGYGIDLDGSVFSPAFWRESTMSPDCPVTIEGSRKPNRKVIRKTSFRYVAGPFTMDERDMAEKMAGTKHKIVEKGGKLWIV